MGYRAAILLLVLFTPMSVLAQKPSSTPSFNQFAVTDIYHGPIALPQFGGRDKKYSEFGTRIKTAMQAGPNFSGAYTVIQIGCGTDCKLIYIASNKTGEVFTFPRGGDNYELEVTYKASSRLIVAQWVQFEQGKCMLEFFEWTSGKANLLKSEVIGSSPPNSEACQNPLSHNFKG
jgi:hypothetical protein